MSESLIIKDGNGSIKSLQVDSGSNGYISNHSLVSTVTASNVLAYIPYGSPGWDWAGDDGVIAALDTNNTRKSVIINNNSETGKCYVLVGSNDFGTITLGQPPQKYSFLLDFGGTYFGDHNTAALEHYICVLSSSELVDSSSITVTVTEIY